MEIIAGKACGTRLDAPAGQMVRPTAARARKSLFDSLGSLEGKVVADLFAGSGALGLEAASRGASEVVFFDDSPASLDCIGDNCARVVKSGVATAFQVVKGRLPGAIDRAVALPRPDLILADPPYAESGEMLLGLLALESFGKWAAKATLVWEMPDFGLAIESFPETWQIKTVRQFGSARFLMIGKLS